MPCPCPCDPLACDSVRLAAEASCSAIMMSPMDMVESSSVKEIGWLADPKVIAEDASKGWVASGSLNVSST